MTLTRALAALLLAATTLLSGCSSGTTPQGRSDGTAGTIPPPASQQEVRRYVALGDSYTSAPAVGITDVADGCLRSEQNYPSLFTKEHDVEQLVDVSCAGATTQDLVRPQRPFGSRVAVPPQLDAVTPDTDLVTLGIGGNDTGLFGRLARDCTRRDQEMAQEMAQDCVSVTDADLDAIGRAVTRSLRLVRQKAPDAIVVLVGYPRLLDGHACPRRIPVAGPDVAALTAVVQDLDAELRAAAARAGVQYADVYAASAGHDLCSADPWVNGVRNQPGKAAALHPFAAEQEAVAALLGELVFG
ncbi:MAG TPA: SGNH/GDSL hydrolase family protein [Marmoricola sp.]|nr:SGNH/GDSL hydrolase family protein [Marmoricola sp.]